jgi:hypothetical protein
VAAGRRRVAAHGEPQRQPGFAQVDVVDRDVVGERARQAQHERGHHRARLHERIHFADLGLVGLEFLEQRDRAVAGGLVALDLRLHLGNLALDHPDLPLLEAKVRAERDGQQDGDAVDEERRADDLDVRQFLIIAEIRMPRRHRGGGVRLTFFLQQ